MANRKKRKYIQQVKAKEEENIKQYLADAKRQKNKDPKIRTILGVQLRKAVLLEDEHQQALKRIERKLGIAVRPLEKWKPPQTRKATPVINNLTRYLFAKYQLPHFLDKVWFDSNPVYLDWYIQMGQGMNIRKLGIPLNYTKKMSHFFMKAPNNLSITQALRWGQVIGFGGDKRLANTIANGHLGTNMENDDFWTKVILFMKNQPMLDPAQINPLIDYIYHQKFHRERVAVGYGRYEMTFPPAPNFEIKGRTVTSLLRGMEAWHRTLRTSRLYPTNEFWKGSPVSDFTYVVGVGSGQRKYQIVQLKSSGELVEEGRAMRHCVASYVYSCKRGACSIWSLRTSDGFKSKPLVTIEVNSRNTIVQARRKFNARPSQKEQNIIRRWAAFAGLTTQYLY